MERTNFEVFFSFVFLHRVFFSRLLHRVPSFIRDEVEPMMRTEEQLIWAYHLFGPVMKRVHVEWTRCLGEMAVALYQLLLRVDKALGSDDFTYMDSFVDVL
jgi:hypothetical protein